MSAGTAKPANPSAYVDPKSAPVKEIPDVLVDPLTKRRYKLGRFSGEGGFAKCYELTDMETKQVFAVKIVPKSQILEQPQREMMSSVIDIHKNLIHPHIVDFHGSFEDNDFVFVVLEFCKRRMTCFFQKLEYLKIIEEPKVRHFMVQLFKGVQYLHSNRIIHRDLKLENIFLNDDMEVKIGGFGLATKIEFEGERKRTLLGTPKHIAPEVRFEEGHSYEVDVWALGCIMYRLLVDRWETFNLKDVYTRIRTINSRRGNFRGTTPWNISRSTYVLIKKMLSTCPTQRPTIAELQAHEFCTMGIIPPRLPFVFSVPPRFSIAPSTAAELSQRPLTALNNKAEANKVEVKEEPMQSEQSDHNLLVSLLLQLKSLTAAQPSERALIRQEEAKDPACFPIFSISKFSGYCSRYGFGYQLCDKSMGMLFPDQTCLIVFADGDSLQYVDTNRAESFFSMRAYPGALSGKISIFKWLLDLMYENPLKAGANIVRRNGDELARLPFLSAWFRTEKAVVMHLSIGTVQINFSNDYTKLILCPLMGAVTYIDEKRVSHSFRLSLLEQFGCTEELLSRILYATEMVEILVNYIPTTAQLSW